MDGAQDGFLRRHCFTQLYLAAKPSHVGVDVDRLACPLHCPMVCDHQTRGQSFLSGVALSHHAAAGGGPFPRGAKPPGLDICCIVDRLGICVTESYMEKLAFTRACLSYIKDIMAIMRVPLVELLS
jgi:hypothetical protein